jgi:hypothetical protein
MSRARYENTKKPNASTPHGNAVDGDDDFSQKAASYARECEKRDAAHAKAHEAQLKKLDDAVPEENGGRRG